MKPKSKQVSPRAQDALKRGYNQKEIDYLFNSIVLPNISYGLAVCGAAKAERPTIQRFLDRCKKRRYILHSIDIHDLSEKHDKKIRTKVIGLEGHVTHFMTCYHLRRKSTVKPTVNTTLFMCSFANRQIFKDELLDFNCHFTYLSLLFTLTIL